MGLAQLTEGKTVFLDSAPIIYVFENKEPYRNLLAPFYLAVDRGKTYVKTSTITFLEVLTKPYQSGQLDLAEKYRRLFKKIDTVSISMEIAEQAARIRAQHGLKTPDAIQWATAQVRGADFFLTNDRQFKKLAGPQILFLEDMVSLQ